jgi:hypothetical protein
MPYEAGGRVMKSGWQIDGVMVYEPGVAEGEMDVAFWRDDRHWADTPEALRAELMAYYDAEHVIFDMDGVPGLLCVVLGDGAYLQAEVSYVTLEVRALVGARGE